jgi:transposase
LTDKEIILELRGIIAIQSQQIKMLEEKVVLLTEKNLYLLEQIQKLGIRKDSSNSSLAPSTDLFKKNQSLRVKSNLARGGQVGHKGSTLEMSANPDKVIELRSNFCNSCGSDLSKEPFVLKAKRQVIELPPISPIYEEYRQYVCQCSGCGNNQVADFPSNVKAPIQYGSSVETLVSYLSIYQSVPFNRLKKMFSQVFSLPLSEGTVDNILNRVALKCEVVYEHIKAEISTSSVVGSDETGVKVNGDKWWIWVWQNVLNTFIVASDNRGFKTIESVFAKGFLNATLVSDRWSAQLKTYAKNHQLCLAHLLRELNFLEELEKNPFSTRFKTLLGSVFEIKKQQLLQKTPCQRGSPDAVLLEKQLNELLAIVIDAKKHPNTTIFQNSMIKHRGYLLPCIYDLGIPADNNGSERAVRIIKVKQKVSGQFKTGQHRFCVVKSVIDTLIKRNLEVIFHLQQIIKLQAE